MASNDNTGLRFIRAAAGVLNLPDTTRRVTIDAEVGGLVTVRIECYCRDAGGLIAVLAENPPADRTEVALSPGDGPPRPRPFAYEVASGGQRVRLEAPTEEGLRLLVNTTGGAGDGVVVVRDAADPNNRGE
jgi:hypothetical protein